MSKQFRLEKAWDGLRFGEVKVENQNGQLNLEVQLCIGDLDPSNLRVQLCAEGESPVRVEMAKNRELVGEDGGFAYTATVPATRPATDFTARVIPHLDGVAVPLESPQVRWQR